MFLLKFYQEQYDYRPSYIINRPINNEASFYRIQQVLEINDEVVFRCSTLETTFDEQYLSYQINSEDLENLTQIKFSDLCDRQLFEAIYARGNFKEYILTMCLI